MATRIFQKKLISETISVQTDMEDRLMEGETIDTVSSSIVVWSGIDPAANTVLLGSATFAGSVITQVVTGGLEGVIYKLLLYANTSMENLLINEVKLAVLDVDMDAL